jgi:hypothetical protein
METWIYNSIILDLGIECRLLVIFTPWVLYPRGKSPRYPLDRRLGGPQSQSGCSGREKILALPENEVFIIIFNKGKCLNGT